MLTKHSPTRQKPIPKTPAQPPQIRIHLPWSVTSLLGPECRTFSALTRALCLPSRFGRGFLPRAAVRHQVIKLPPRNLLLQTPSLWACPVGLDHGASDAAGCPVPTLGRKAGELHHPKGFIKMTEGDPQPISVLGGKNSYVSLKTVGPTDQNGQIKYSCLQLTGAKPQVLGFASLGFSCLLTEPAWSSQWPCHTVHSPQSCPAETTPCVSTGLSAQDPQRSKRLSSHAQIKCCVLNPTASF